MGPRPSVPEGQMRVIGEIEPDLVRHDVINEMESEGVQVTIDTQERLLTVLLPRQLRRDLSINFALRVRLIITENLIDDYLIALGSDGEVIVKVHYHAAKYREIG